jgi:hypothetical protein
MKQTKDGSKPAVYASLEQIGAYTAPTPLEEDYTHSECNFTFHIKGISKAKDRTVIYDNEKRMVANRAAVALICGYPPSDDEINWSSWCAACITAPLMTAEQWLKFGAEAGIGELWLRCLTTSRLREDAPVNVPTGEEAAEAELKADPF